MKKMKHCMLSRTVVVVVDVAVMDEAVLVDFEPSDSGW